MSKRSFKQMTQGMTFGEKWEYLWEYYRWVLLVAAFGAIVIAMVVTGVVNNSGKVFYSGAVVNVPLGEEGKTFLTDQMEETFGASKSENAKLFETYFQDLENTYDLETNAAAAFQLVLMITAEDYDYVIMDETAWEYYRNHPVFTSLDEILPEEKMNQYSERIVRYQPADSIEMPLAVDITDSAFAQMYTTGETKIYIAFPGNTGRTEFNDDFLEYLMNAA